MNIYLVERISNWDYDEYDSFVCLAENEETAKELHPGDLNLNDFHQDGRYTKYNYWSPEGWYRLHTNRAGIVEKVIETHPSWPHDLKDMKVTFLGTSEKTIPRVVCASFNAG